MLLQPMATIAITPRPTKLDARIRRSFSAKRANATRAPITESSSFPEQGINVPPLSNSWAPYKIVKLIAS
jgi:hypothetical protein